MVSWHVVCVTVILPQLHTHQPPRLFLNHPAGLCPLKQDRAFSRFSPQRRPALLTLRSLHTHLTTVTVLSVCDTVSDLLPAARGSNDKIQKIVSVLQTSDT